MGTAKLVLLRLSSSTHHNSTNSPQKYTHRYSPYQSKSDFTSADMTSTVWLPTNNTQHSLTSLAQKPEEHNRKDIYTHTQQKRGHLCHHHDTVVPKPKSQRPTAHPPPTYDSPAPPTRCDINPPPARMSLSILPGLLVRLRDAIVAFCALACVHSSMYIYIHILR